VVRAFQTLLRLENHSNGITKKTGKSKANLEVLQSCMKVTNAKKQCFINVFWNFLKTVVFETTSMKKRKQTKMQKQLYIQQTYPKTLEKQKIFVSSHRAKILK